MPASAQGLLQFVHAAPSPHHCAAEAARLLQAAGFVVMDESQPFETLPVGHKGLIVRGGALIAWILGEDAPERVGFNLVGAHTDSPNLRLRPRPDRRSSGFAQLGVEVYGSPLLNSWLDRDLGLSGRVACRSVTGPALVDVLFDEPLLRIPQLAIHLDRSIGTEGLRLDPQRHLVPVWSAGEAPELRGWLAGRLGARPLRRLSALLMWGAAVAMALAGRS